MHITLRDQGRPPSALNLAPCAALALLLAAPSASAAAPPRASFDCARASTAVERAICRTPALGALDLELARAFQARLRAAPVEAGEVRSDQLAWLAHRDAACATALPECIEPLYRARLAELAAAPAPAPTPAPTPAAAEPGCRSGKVVALDLAAFRAALAAARTKEQAGAAFALLGVGYPAAWEQDEPIPYARAHVTVHPFSLTRPGKSDRVIAVEIPGTRYASEGIYRHLVALQAQEARRWCVLGSLSLPGYEDPFVASYELKPVHLVSPELDAVEVSTQEAWQGGTKNPSSLRAYWAVLDAGLSLVVAEELSGSEMGVSGFQSGATIALAGGYPKEIRVTRSTSRFCREEVDVHCPPDGTVGHTERTRLVFRDGRYRDAERPLLASAPLSAAEPATWLGGDVSVLADALAAAPDEPLRQLGRSLRERAQKDGSTATMAGALHPRVARLEVRWERYQVAVVVLHLDAPYEPGWGLPLPFQLPAEPAALPANVGSAKVDDGAREVILTGRPR